MKKVWRQNYNISKASHLVKGAWAEQLAHKWLQQQGLRPIERNYRVPHGEIDLIMMDAEVLVFVEVRYRGNNKWIDPLATLHPYKRQRLANAADLYLQSHQKFYGNQCRFDVVAVRGNLAKPELEWVKDAFNL